jgi:hypothetical protein
LYWNNDYRDSHYSKQSQQTWQLWPMLFFLSFAKLMAFSKKGQIEECLLGQRIFGVKKYYATPHNLSHDWLKKY